MRSTIVTSVLTKDKKQTIESACSDSDISQAELALNVLIQMWSSWSTAYGEIMCVAR